MRCAPERRNVQVVSTTPHSEFPRSVVGIGASAGGVEALIRLVAGLPRDLDAALLVVLHLPPTGPSVLAEILGRHCALPTAPAQDGEPLVAGRMLVAPPDRHLLVEDGHVRLERGPKENGVRPAVDPMLRSLAAAYGPRSVAVILSGALGDGAGGARVVAAAGGHVLVQDPDDAVVSSMPQRAIERVDGAAAVLGADDIGERLVGLLGAPPAIRKEMPMVDADPPVRGGPNRPEGPPTGFTCPECHGALWTVPEAGGFRYRCRIGHAYSEEALVGAQGGKIEAALWTALEVLEERAELLDRIADRHRGGDRPRSETRMRLAADDARSRADLLRDALAAGERPVDALAVDTEDLPS